MGLFDKIDTIDKLLKMTWEDVLNIRTIGSGRREVLEAALREYFSISSESEREDKLNVFEDESNIYRNVSIDEIGLPLGIVYRLKTDGIEYLDELINLPKEKLNRLRGENEAAIIEEYTKYYLQKNNIQRDGIWQEGKDVVDSIAAVEEDTASEEVSTERDNNDIVLLTMYDAAKALNVSEAHYMTWFQKG